MNNQLTIPENKITPKPTKNEIIAALVEIARGKFIEEQKGFKAEREANTAAFEKHAMKRFKAEWKTTEPDICFYSSGKVQIVFTLAADEITKKHNEVDDKLRYFKLQQKFDEKNTRYVIRNNVTGSSGTSHEERVAAILNDKETAKYLEEVYAGIIAPKEPAIENTVEV